MKNFKEKKNYKKILDTALEVMQNPNEIEIAFMARTLVQATLPHSDPGEIPIWGRRNGNLTLTIKPDWELGEGNQKPRCVGIPYGTIPRLLLFWIITEAVRTKKRRITLGDSLSAFMGELGMTPTGGRWGSIPRLKEQMNRLFRAKISFDLIHDIENTHKWIDMQVAPIGELWWNPKFPDQKSLWKSWIELGENFYESICIRPVPVDMRVLQALKRSPLALDLYAWMNYRTFTVNKQEGQFITWLSLMNQLGSNYTNLKDFCKNVKNTLRKITTVSEGLRIEFSNGGLFIYPRKKIISFKKINPLKFSE